MIGRSISVAIVAFFLLSALIPSIGSNQAIPPNDSISILSFNQVNAQVTGPVEVPIPVKGTFLRSTSQDGAPEAPAIVDLISKGIPVNCWAEVTYTGWFNYFGDSNTGDYYGALIGLFSTSSVLLSIDQLHRVPGAIAIGSNYPYQTVTTTDDAGHNQPTDIPEDFYIGRNSHIQVPSNAKFLFICVPDSKYSDNYGNLTVTIDTRIDTDGDGLYDSWEQNGIDGDNDGDIDLVLTGADWQHKDIFVEVDYMPGLRPYSGAINDVKTAFAKAPIQNPDNRNGINLHVIVDQEIGYAAWTRVWGGFDDAKMIYFGTTADQISPNKAAILEAWKLVAHYSLFINQMAFWNNETAKWDLDKSSGMAELPGNDFMVALGKSGGGDRMQQASTFMHELGHNLGLHHGGKDDINFKPNYLSIMNYMFQFNYRYPNRPMDYSRIKLDPLNEATLNETKGVGVDYVSAGSGGWLFTGHRDPIQNKSVLSLLRPIDWNGDNQYNFSVRANVNNCTDWNYRSKPDELLNGSNDWASVNLAFRNLPTYTTGVHGECPPEITTDVMEFMNESAQNYHEVALVNATPSSNIVYHNSILDMTVNSVNLGANNETVDLSVYAGTTLIAQRAVSLERSNITSTVLRCDVSAVPKGDQVIAIRLAQVPGEEDTFDNNFTYGAIEFTGEATPPPADQSWPLILGFSVAVVAVIAIALFIVTRKRQVKK